MTEVRYEVRPARVEDFAAVCSLESRCFSDPWTPVALLQELASDDLRQPLVITVDGRVRGYVMAWRVADQLHILNIAADPDRRRRGLGTLLLRESARRAAAADLVEITLEVRRGNTAARAFYSRHGFAETGVRRGYYTDNGEDAIIMTCPVAGVLGRE